MRKTRFGSISSFANLCWYFFIIQGSKEGLKIRLDDAFLVHFKNDRYFFNGLGLENILAALTREIGNGPCFRKNRGIPKT